MNATTTVAYVVTRSAVLQIYGYWKNHVKQLLTCSKAVRFELKGKINLYYDAIAIITLEGTRI